MVWMEEGWQKLDDRHAMVGDGCGVISRLVLVAQTAALVLEIVAGVFGRCLLGDDLVSA